MKRDIVVIGGSAGALPVAQSLVEALPNNFQASLFFVMHLPPGHFSRLAEILSARGTLPAAQVTTSELIQPGAIYVAAPDCHLVIEGERVQAWRGPKEDRHRPAINPLFRSAAIHYGPRVIAVVLSGALTDGSAGVWWVKQHGGTTIVQNPQTAEFPDMPASVMEYTVPDHIVDARDVAPLLLKLIEDSAERGDMKDQEVVSSEVLQVRCPDCHGPLSEMRQGKVLEYRCLVGHRYSDATVLQSHTDAVEDALWSAVVGLEESAILMRRLLPQVSNDVAAGLLRNIEKRRELAILGRRLIEGLDMGE